MKGHTRLLMRPWILSVAVVALIAGHGFVYYALRHVSLSAAVVSVLVLLVVIKHLGLLGPLYSWFRRRARQ